MPFQSSRPLRLIAAAVLAFGVAACDSGSPTEAAAAKGTAAPAGKDWSQAVSVSPQGGIVIGNPNAKVTLLEYASYTCPHCATFEAEGVPALLRNYVAGGKVRYEMRSFPIHGAVDVAMTLLAMCQPGAQAWTFSKALFQSQDALIQGFQAIPQDQLTALQKMSPDQAIPQYADMGGLDDFAKVRGVPKARFQQCLTDKANLAKFEANAAEAQDKYKLNSTPWFVIDGESVPNTSNWLALEPKLKEALN